MRWQSYSHFLMHMRRPDEAMAQIERALELDPFNVIVRSFYAVDLLYVRRYDEAIAEARKALAMQPGAPVAYSALYQALFRKGCTTKLSLWTRNDSQATANTRRPSNGATEKRGYRGSQKRWAEAYAARTGKADPGGLAMGYIYAGENELALNLLEKAVAARNPNLPYLGVPVYDSLRSDPRFQSLLRRMGLPQ